MRRLKLFKFGLDLKVIWKLEKESKKDVTINYEIGKGGNVKT